MMRDKEQEAVAAGRKSCAALSLDRPISLNKPGIVSVTR